MQRGLCAISRQPYWRPLWLLTHLSSHSASLFSGLECTSIASAWLSRALDVLFPTALNAAVMDLFTAFPQTHLFAFFLWTFMLLELILMLKVIVTIWLPPAAWKALLLGNLCQNRLLSIWPLPWWSFGYPLGFFTPLLLTEQVSTWMSLRKLLTF